MAFHALKLDANRRHATTHAMKIGPRFVSKFMVYDGMSAERAALEHTLATAPGLIAVQRIEPHRKGGRQASLEIERTLLDQSIAHMDSQGWMDGP
ncbi:hypothetical protein AVXHC19_17080 [Acidovorax sacchari]